MNDLDQKSWKVELVWIFCLVKRDLVAGLVTGPENVQIPSEIDEVELPAPRFEHDGMDDSRCCFTEL